MGAVFLCWFIQIYVIICVVRVVLSWVPLGDESGILGSISTIAYTVTEPLFNTIRRSIPAFGDLPIDLSPAIVILGLGILRQLFCHFA